MATPCVWQLIYTGACHTNGMATKIKVFGQQAKELMQKIGLVADEDQSPFKGMARLHFVEGRAVVELEMA